MAPVNVSLIDPQSNQAFEVSTDPVKAGRPAGAPSGPPGR